MGKGRKDAYEATGCRGKHWRQQAYKWEQLETVQRRLHRLRDDAAKRAIATKVDSDAVTRAEIVSSLRETREMARRGVPQLARDGTETGVYRPDLAAKNRSDECLAKMHGFMLDVVKTEDFAEELAGMDETELKATVLSLVEQLDPNLRKQVLAEAAGEAVEGEDENIEPRPSTMRLQ